MSNNNNYSLHMIVMKLIGDANPIGDSNIDKLRFENLKVLTELIELLVLEVSQIKHNVTRIEYSMRIMGEHADKFLKELKEQL